MLAKRAPWTLAAQVIGLLGAIALMAFLRAHYVFDFGDAAFGKLTTGIIGQHTGFVHCQGYAPEPCQSVYEKAGSPPAVLWFGNSQLPGVNRYSPGEKTAPMLLHEALRPEGKYVFTLSLAGATTYEHAVLFESAGRRLNLHTLVLPVVFQSLRASPLRESMSDVLRRPETLKGVANSPLAPSLAPLASTVSTASESSAGEKSFAARFEDRVNSVVATGWPLWGERDKLQGLMRYVFYRLRHTALGTNSQTKRPAINASYSERVAVIRNLVKAARARGARVLLYIAPYRSDIPGPYIQTEYARFKADMAALAREEGARFADIDAIVPGPEWGMIRDYLFGNDDYDFAHFTAGGQRRLFEAVRRELAAMER